MKKVIFTLILFLSFSLSIKASDIVTLNKCVDGDTAWFNLKGEVIKVRFLAIDTPESTNSVEPFGKEASNYTCNMLKEANMITLEYDANATKDKYERTLAWVFVDDNLLQDLIIQKGLGEVAYLYGDYKYTSKLQTSEIIAKSNHLGMWGNNYDFYYLIIILIVIVILCIFNKSFRNKILNQMLKKIKRL